MSEAVRTNEIYLNIEQTSMTTGDGGTLSRATPFILHRNSKTIVQAHLRLRDTVTPFAPTIGSSWFFALDNSYDPDSADPVFTLDANFNKAEYWNELDVAVGKIAWEINCATTQLSDKFANATPANPAILPNVVGELWMTAPGGDPVLMGQWDITMKNIVSQIDNDTTLEYLSSNLLREDGDDTVLYFPDGTEAQRWSK